MSNLATRIHAWPERWLAAALLIIAVTMGTPAVAQDALRFTEAWSPEDCELLKAARARAGAGMRVCIGTVASRGY